MFLLGFVLVLAGFIAGLINQAVDNGFHEVKEDNADHTDEGNTNWAFRDDELDEIEDHAGNHIRDNEVDIHHSVHSTIDIMKILFIDAHYKSRDNDQHHAENGLRDDVDHTLADFSAWA